MVKEVVVDVSNVSKNFRLPHEQSRSMKHVFVNLFKRRKGHNKAETQHALKDVDFKIYKGEFFGIVGRNGSGKSTLLKMIAGIYQPTKGKIVTKGKLVPFIELGVGFNPDLTGRENVYLNGALIGFTKAEIDAQYDDIVEFAELEDFMDQKLKNYSSGMQVRLAFSLAIRAESDILLVDEVLAVGDADFQRKCYDFFGQLKKQGQTVIFVTHDMGAVREYCDRAILIEDHEVIARGDANKVASKYSRLFLEEKKPEKEEETKEEHVKRWGSGAMKYTSVKLSNTKLTDQEHIDITVTAEAYQTVENPILGFSVKSASGVAILGTNNQIKQMKLGIIKKGERVTLTWRVPNIFGDGKFYVDAAITEHDAITICEWWEDAAAFQSYKEERVPYSVAPTIGLTRKK